MKRRYQVTLMGGGLPIFVLISACAAGSLGLRPGVAGNASCAKDQSVSLVDATAAAQGAAIQMDRTQPIGGVLSIDSLVPRGTEIVSMVRSKFSDLKFGGSAACSAVLEFRKSDSRYLVDALVNSYCFVPKLIYKGRNPTLKVYLGGRTDLSPGYETLPVELAELTERDRILRTLESLPNVTDAVRSAFLDRAFNSERLLAIRGLLAGQPEGSADAAVGKELCTAVPESEIAAFASNPNANPGDDPNVSGKPRPVDCQMFVSSRWITFSVPAEVADQKRAWLDSLVHESNSNRTNSATSPKISSEMRTALTDFRRLDAEVYQADIRWQQLVLGLRVVRAANGGCTETKASTTDANKLLAGPSRDAYFDLAKTLVPLDVRPLFESLRGHACAQDAALTSYRSKIDESVAASDAKFLELARVLGQLQSLMKAKKEQVGIATNHIRNLTGSEVAIEFKDLPLFPAGGAVATELQRHTFNFDNPWLSATFDRTKAHPGANNLRTDFNDGYAVTFGGVPVGAVSAMTDESGGVAAIPLPERKPVTANAPSSEPNGKSAPGDAERNRADQKSVPVADCK